jgi:hypothetical protein
MSSLTGQKIKDTYQSLLKTDDNGLVTNAFKNITDGSGSASGLYLKNNGVLLSGSVDISGSLNAISITGSLQGTSSFAISASWAPNNIDIGSLVTTSSFNNFTSSYNTGSFSGSFTGSLQGTSSFALSASWAPSMETGSFATTGSNQFRGDQTITGSLILSGSRIALAVSGGAAPTLQMTTSSFELGGLIGQVISYSNINIETTVSEDIS